MTNPLDSHEIRQILSPYLPDYQIEMAWPSGKPYSDFIAEALRFGDFKIAYWLMSRSFPGFDPFHSLKNFERCPESRHIDRMMEHAAHTDRYDVCKWVIDNDLVKEEYPKLAVSYMCYHNNATLMSLIRWDEKLVIEAAMYGHTNCIRFATSIGVSFDERSCSAAACCGQLQTLRYLRENGCPWNHELFAACLDSLDDDYYEEDFSDVRAIRACMEYARENGCPEHP